jgi:hypothetical protein
MSSLPPPLSDEEFCSYLASVDAQPGSKKANLQSRYRKAIKKIRQSTKKKIEGQKQTIRERLIAELDREELHREILNACLFPFATGTVPGYLFVRAAPLLELGVKNLDFIIVCTNPPANELPVAIIGECKGLLEDEDRVVSEMKKRIKVVEAKWDYIKEQYLHNQNMNKEFVLAVMAIDANEISKRVQERGGNIIVWKVDRSNMPLLAINRPAEKGQIFATMLHANRRLTEALSNKIVTSTQYKMFYLQSHTVAKLKILTSIDKPTEGSTFRYEDVKQEVENALHYIKEDDVINSETSLILENAKKIGFVREVGNGYFKIQSRHKNAYGRENDIKNKWIDNRVEMKSEKLINEETAAIQDSFRRDIKKQHKMNEYPS